MQTFDRFQWMTLSYSFLFRRKCPVNIDFSACHGFLVYLFCSPPPLSFLKHAGIGHAMVNKLHYLVDIILIVLYFGLPWVFRHLFQICLPILIQTLIGSKVARKKNLFFFFSTLSFPLVEFQSSSVPNSQEKGQSG